MLVVIVGLVALLPVLAALQYRWIGQLNDNEVERLRVNLESSAELFGRAINQEFFPANFAFRVSFTGSRDQIARELSLNYQYWTSRVSRPDLIDDIYWIEYDLDENLRLYKFEPAYGVLNEQPWPESLLGWRDYLVLRNQRQVAQYNRGETDEAEDKAFEEMGARLMAERPAIPIPVSIDNELSPDELFANLNATSSGRAGHTLLTINQEYLRTSFFPELEKEFFSTNEELDFLIVSNTEDQQVVYKSDSSLSSAMFDQADAEVQIGRFRWNRFASASRLAFGYASLIDRDKIVADTLIGRVQRVLQPAVRDSFMIESGVVHTDFPLHAIIRLAQEDEYRGELTAEDLLVALTNLTRDEIAERETQEARADSVAQAQPPAINDDPSFAWVIKMRHKTGSLAASVAANRTRNLALSFGILLVLGIATVMIYSSSRKAHHLASRQMSFVTGVSHELRTPLSVIKSAADNLADGVVNEDRMQKYGQLIRRESSRLNNMVEQILQLAGVMSHDKTFVFEPTQVDALIEAAIEDCSEELTSKGFDLDLNIASNLPDIHGDGSALQAAIANLISNAIKYSNGSRWIGIKTHLTQNGKGPEIQIQIADKGIGVPEADLPYIFEDFFRGASVREAQIKGNGIGLSIVKKTMEAHNGSVSVKQNEDTGTTFTLHLPAKN